MQFKSVIYIYHSSMYLLSSIIISIFSNIIYLSVEYIKYIF